MTPKVNPAAMSWLEEAGDAARSSLRATDAEAREQGRSEAERFLGYAVKANRR